MKLRGDRDGFKGIFVKRMFGVKKPRAKVPHKQKKNACEGCHISTVNAPFVHLAFLLMGGA